jgi:hypothetical protein
LSGNVRNRPLCALLSSEDWKVGVLEDSAALVIFPVPSASCVSFRTTQTTTRMVSRSLVLQLIDSSALDGQVCRSPSHGGGTLR